MNLTMSSERKENLLNQIREMKAEDILEIREYVLRHLQELQADFEELSNEELVDCRECMLERVKSCLTALNESNEDNLLP